MRKQHTRRHCCMHAAAYILTAALFIAAPAAVYAEEPDIPVVNTPQDAIREVSAAESTAFFSIDVSSDSAELASEPLNREVNSILAGSTDESTKQADIPA